MGGNIAYGWHFDTARSSYAMNDCNPVSVTGSNSTVTDGWKCHDLTNNTYSIGLNVESCVGAVEARVRNINWSAVSFGSSTTSAAANFSGYTKYTCSATYDGIPLNCTNINVTFNKTGVAIASSNFNYSNVTQIGAADALSSSISSSDANQQSLLRLQCYANPLYNNNAIRTATQSSNLCIREVKANWGTTDRSKFLVDHGPLKSKAEHADGTSIWILSKRRIT